MFLSSEVFSEYWCVDIGVWDLLSSPGFTVHQRPAVAELHMCCYNKLQCWHANLNQNLRSINANSNNVTMIVIFNVGPCVLSVWLWDRKFGCFHFWIGKVQKFIIEPSKMSPIDFLTF